MHGKPAEDFVKQYVYLCLIKNPVSHTPRVEIFCYDLKHGLSTQSTVKVTVFILSSHHVMKSS